MIFFATNLFSFITHHSFMHLILTTPRLILRRFTEADASLVYQLNSNPEVVKYVHEPLLQNEEAARKIIVDIILPQYENNLGRWAIHTKATNEFIGWCGLKFLQESGEIDLGYRFHPFAWGKGYATEAAQHVLDYGFKMLHLKEIIGRAHVENIGSLNVLQKIGMQFIKESIEDNCPVKIFRSINAELSISGQ
jgi:RimJ/RimL family protein N-acetyltransferase